MPLLKISFSYICVNFIAAPKHCTLCRSSPNYETLRRLPIKFLFGRKSSGNSPKELSLNLVHSTEIPRARLLRILLFSHLYISCCCCCCALNFSLPRPNGRQHSKTPNDNCIETRFRASFHTPSSVKQHQVLTKRILDYQTINGCASWALLLARGSECVSIAS